METKLFPALRTGAISLFQAKVFHFNTEKTPLTEEIVIRLLAQLLFRASGALFEFNPFYTVFTVFQAEIRGLNDFSRRKSSF